MNDQQIRETLKIQPLSEDEKASRHILGRLYGPIATGLEGTRNGRKYNEELWNRQIEDDILKEKIACKSLFLELGHPIGREETDMEKVCACIPEMPKMINGDLYAYVDILDTPNGKLLKKLIDYGFVPGISSRGSGDVMDNNEVDPETFFLETWDIVQLPAVKKARLAICESMDVETAKMKKALAETICGSSDKDRDIMKESLNNLNIKLDEAKEPKSTDINWANMADSDIPDADDRIDPVLIESASDNDINWAIIADKDIPDAGDNIDPALMESAADDEEVTAAEENAETNAETQEGELSAIEVLKSKLDIREEDNELIIAAKGALEDEDAQKINVEVTEDEAEAIVAEFGIEEGQNSEKSDDIEEVENSEEKEESDADDSDEDAEEAKQTKDEAADDGLDEIMESFKKIVREKEALENDVKALKRDSAVSDAKVKSLKEDLDKYKKAFARVSEVAANSKAFEKEVQTLKEAVETKTAEIQTLKAKVANATKLTEGINADESRIKTLSENLREAQAELSRKDEAFDKAEKQYKAKLNEKIDIAKKYKAKFNLVLNRYIESKASMLGVRSAEITGRLNESYTLDDIDRICDELLTSSAPMGRLPFGNGRGAAKAAIKESASGRPQKSNPDCGYDIDDDLLILAGLK